MKVGIVTCEKCRYLSDSERPLISMLAERGIAAIPLVWNDPAVDWTLFRVLIVRSVWDYHLHAEAFHLWLNERTNQRIITWNSIPVIRNNAHKFYLRDLQSAGVSIVPTLFIPRGSTSWREQIMTTGWQKIVVKPAVSASGYQTHTWPVTALSTVADTIQSLSDAQDMLIQEFMAVIEDPGELSLIFLQKQFSHAVRKKPKPGDFRVQVEYGGDAVPVQPDDAIIRSAQQILDRAGKELLYARVDGVILNHQFVLMELELIEPDLFLDAHPEARNRFVDAIEEVVRRPL